MSVRTSGQRPGVARDPNFRRVMAYPPGRAYRSRPATATLWAAGPAVRSPGLIRAMEMTELAWDAGRVNPDRASRAVASPLRAPARGPMPVRGGYHDGKPAEN
jgi:hypothetical protein